MDCPYFTVSEHGVFDSNVKFPRTITTRVRQVQSYELEFYTADCPGETYIDGRTHTLKCGTVICAKPGQKRNSRLPFRCHYFHLETKDPALIELLENIPEHFLPGEFHSLIDIFQDLLAIESPRNTEDRLLLESCICRILSVLSRRAHAGTLTESATAFHHQKILLDAEKYIREHLSEELSLEVLAGRCNLSPTYFHRLFTEYFKITPANFILECRIAAAKTGLLAGSYSLAELAADCGFSSQAYFCYKFKLATGKTPLQYRKEMLGRLTV